jgi:hypothetical protein
MQTAKNTKLTFSGNIRGKWWDEVNYKKSVIMPITSPMTATNSDHNVCIPYCKILQCGAVRSNTWQLMPLEKTNNSKRVPRCLLCAWPRGCRCSLSNIDRKEMHSGRPNTPLNSDLLLTMVKHCNCTVYLDKNCCNESEGVSASWGWGGFIKSKHRVKERFDTCLKK